MGQNRKKGEQERGPKEEVALNGLLTFVAVESSAVYFKAKMRKI